MSENKEKSPLIRELCQQWERNGSSLPSVKEQKRLKREYVNARKNLESVKAAARKQVAEAEQKLSDSARACVEAFGKTPLIIGEDLYAPVSRGRVVYYRKRGRKEPEGI